jgi:hypothetical protein
MRLEGENTSARRAAAGGECVHDCLSTRPVPHHTQPLTTVFQAVTLFNSLFLAFPLTASRCHCHRLSHTVAVSHCTVTPPCHRR